ncbi:MAG: Spi family protease inhibitor [Pseudoflavonifractor sp.]|nr:Spi family protease inhibitor [Alloprevotella sp.]MCM1117552.1 Spi family protease inhibitor [Pseudoflavonifractor sp.]
MPTIQTTQKLDNRSKEVGPSEAAHVAETFSGLQNSTYLRGRSGSTIDAINDDFGMPLAYVVNLADGGWVIVSATKDYFPVMAYSDDIDAHLDVNDQETNEILRMWPLEIMSTVMNVNDAESKARITQEWQRYEYSNSTFASGRKTRKGKRISVDINSVSKIHTFNPRKDVVMAQIVEAGGIEHYKGQIFWFSMDGKSIRYT